MFCKQDSTEVAHLLCSYFTSVCTCVEKSIFNNLALYYMHCSPLSCPFGVPGFSGAGLADSNSNHVCIYGRQSTDIWYNGRLLGRLDLKYFKMGIHHQPWHAKSRLLINTRFIVNRLILRWTACRKSEAVFHVNTILPLSSL